MSYPKYPDIFPCYFCKEPAELSSAAVGHYECKKCQEKFNLHEVLTTLSDKGDVLYAHINVYFNSSKRYHIRLHLGNDNYEGTNVTVINKQIGNSRQDILVMILQVILSLQLMLSLVSKPVWSSNEMLILSK